MVQSIVKSVVQSVFKPVVAVDEGLIILNGISYDNTDQAFELDVAITPMNLTLNPSIAGDDKVLDTFYVPTGLSVETDNSLSTFGQITGTLDAGLTDDYYEMAVRVTARGAYTGQQDVIVVFNLDTVAPVLSSPTDTKTNDTQATASVSTNKAGGICYATVTTSATSPEDYQVIAGQDHTGASAAATDSGTVSGTGVQNFSFTGLTPSTQYYTHFVHPDGATITNTSDVVSADGFMTDAAATVAAIYKVNFHSSVNAGSNVNDPNGKYWNNVATVSGSATNIVDEDNVASVYDVTISDQGANANDWVGATLDDGTYPNEVWYSVHTVETGNDVMVVQFASLDNGTGYGLRFGSLHNGAFTGRTADFTFGSQTIEDFESGLPNAPNIGELLDPQTPTDGVLTLTVTLTAGGITYLNWLELIEYA